MIKFKAPSYRTLHSYQNYFMIKSLKNFTSNIILFFFFWVLADYICTKIYYKFVKVNVKVEADQEVRIKHDIFHHTFSPNINVIKEHGKYGRSKQITNSLGFRDKTNRKIFLNKSNQIKKRIVFIGDSVTEGIFLNYEDTFVGLIDKYFEKKNIQVLNAGVVAYSPSIYFAKINYFLEQGLKFDELVVFIDISDIVDEAIWYDLDLKKKRIIERKYLIRKNIIEKKEGEKHVHIVKRKLVFLLKKDFYLTFFTLNLLHDITFLTLNNFLAFYMKNISHTDIINFIVSDDYSRDKWTINEKIYEKYKVGVEMSLRNMSLLKKMCDKENVKLTIAVYPLVSQVYYNDLESKQVKIWKKFSKENNIQFINFFPLFIDTIDESKNNRIEKIKKYYIVGDIHFNSLGNKMIADYFISNFKY